MKIIVEQTKKGTYIAEEVGEYKTPEEIADACRKYFEKNRNKEDKNETLEITPKMEMMEKLKFWLRTESIRDLFVDCCQGDKFQIFDVGFNKNGDSIQLKINKASLGWIKLDAIHPVKLCQE